MIPTTFDQQNKIYTKPEGWIDEQCSDLPTWEGSVKVVGTEMEIPAIISCWKLSYEDLQEIQKTGCVWLSITGKVMPPVSVSVENPFVNE